MRAPYFDARDIYSSSDERIGCLLAGFAGGCEPSEAHTGKLCGSVFDDRGSNECLAASCGCDDESAMGKQCPLDCSLLVGTKQKSLRRFNFRMILVLHSVSLRSVCLGLDHPPELALSGGLSFVGG